jgi:hypothetical protein
MDYLKYSHALEYWLMPTRALKKMPHKGDVITPNNMNSGYTYPSNKKVFIYRCEEAPKVLLHETLHHSCYHKDAWPTQAVMELYKQFYIDRKGCSSECNTSLLPNEAVVEFWAEMYHLSFLSLEYNIPFGQLLEKERAFAVYQARKILEHQKTMEGQLWRESSHAFSYIVLRSLLLFAAEEVQKIPAPYDQHALRRLCTLMIDTFHSKKYQDALATKRRMFKPFRDETLRMTYFGDF